MWVWDRNRNCDSSCVCTVLVYFSDRIWARFLMSFLINGIGYHVLVHALPLQGAQQSSLTSFVLRSVGMIYLVDLDDTPGYKLTIVVPPPPPPVPEATAKALDDDVETKKVLSDQEDPPLPPPTMTETAPPVVAASAAGASGFSSLGNGNNYEDELSQAALAIIEDAKRKLDALLYGGNGSSSELLATGTDTTGNTNFKATPRNLLLGVFPTTATTASTTTNTTAPNPTPPSQQQQEGQPASNEDLNPGMAVILTAMMASGGDNENNDNEQEEETVDA